MQLPKAFSEQMQTQLGSEWPAFLEALSAPPPVSIRLHPLKNLKLQENAGKVKWSSDGLYLSERPVFTLDPCFHAGAYYVQEASSMFVGEAVRQLTEPGPPIRVLDLCAAPGGKSTLLLSTLPQDSLVLANEVIRSRYQPLRHNLVKWGYPNSCSSMHDSREFSGLEGFFDLILVDAPCSGEGLFRKDPGATAEWSEEGVQLCAGRQKRILADAVKLLAPAGILLYCTCTYNRQENEDNASWLKDSFGLHPEPLRLEPEWGIVASGLGYQFYPHRVRGEGFYLAAFRKTDGPSYPIPKLRSFAPRGYQPLPGHLKDNLKEWAHDPDALALFQNATGKIIAFPKQHEECVAQLGHVLSRFQVGVELGQFKKKDFVPAHSLALSTLAAGPIPRPALQLEAALQYLKKETISVEGAPEGWALVAYHGLPLGWIKGLKNRINNYFPKEWRIRMDVKGAGR